MRAYNDLFPSAGGAGWQYRIGQDRGVGALARARAQVVDLRGWREPSRSLFGSMGAQPSQKAFEGRLALALARLDPARLWWWRPKAPGECRLPPRSGGRWWPRQGWRSRCRRRRGGLLARAYADLVADPARLDGVLAALSLLRIAAR
ncbi:MAG: hypothetical protein R3D90_15895 [Paracoccaceae bacterium]